MNLFSILALLVAGAIHLLPVPGVLGAPMLRRLYGVDASDPDLAILLQHRALLFGLLGLFMLSAIPWPSLRLPAGLVGLASALGFVVVARLVGGYNDALARVVAADLVASVALLVVLVLEGVRLSRA